MSIAKTYKEIGQIKPVVLRKTSVDKQGRQLYVAVFGQTRIHAARVAELQYIKAFVLDKPSKLTISLLQCAEDLSESDTPWQRARVLYDQFLQQREAQHGYTKEQFIHEYQHLASKETMRRAFRFIELDPFTKRAVIEGLLDYHKGLQIGEAFDQEHALSHDHFSLLYEAITGRYGKDAIDKCIKKMRGGATERFAFPYSGERL